VSLKKLVTQPPFAPQMTDLPRALGTNVPLQRGYMIWAKPMTSFYSGGGPLGDGRDMIKFSFNPSTVSTDYNVANASLQATMMYTVPGDQGNLLSPLLSQTVSWSLYFDRTYELNYGGNSSAVNDPAVVGVQADVYQFMQFTGVLADLDKQRAFRCRQVQPGRHVNRPGRRVHGRDHDDGPLLRVLRQLAPADDQ
jgi:hypothetical protein